MAGKAKQGGKNRKVGRAKKACESYRARQQRERNKAVKIARHLKRHPGDEVSINAFKSLPASFQKGLL